MKVFVIFIELLGLSLLCVELGLLINKGATKAHIFGYLGAACIVLGSILWNKLLRNSKK